jgi:uncharacterized membrane protein
MFPFIFVLVLIAGCFATFFGVRDALDPSARAAVNSGEVLYEHFGAAAVAYGTVLLGIVLLLVGIIGLWRFYAHLKRW